MWGVLASLQRTNPYSRTLLTSNSGIGRMGVLAVNTWGVFDSYVGCPDSQDVAYLDNQDMECLDS
eukprot:1383505-Amorphochlora_amoeboformis.AAC.1